MRVAPNRLTVSAFLAGFTLAAVVALFTVLPALDQVDGGTLVLALADGCMGAATLLFLFTTMATYVALQRLANLPPRWVEAVDHGQEELPDLTERERATLGQARAIYDEPAPFIVWGLALIVAGLALIGWHITPALGVALAVTTAAIIARVRTLHDLLRRVFTGASLWVDDP